MSFRTLVRASQKNFKNFPPSERAASHPKLYWVTCNPPMLAFHSRCNARALTCIRLYSEQKSLHNQPIIDFLRKCTCTCSCLESYKADTLSGQKDEETRPDVNTFKITAYKHAVRSISQVQQPIRIGNDISKVCNTILNGCHSSAYFPSFQALDLVSWQR